MYFVLNGRNCFMIYDFSMIVGTLGCISGIKKLVNSISLNQNLNFQVILIIQENFDNINKLFINKEYANIDIILLESEKGLSRARNHGLKYATGNIICFPDDDVYYDNTTLLLVNKILLKSNFDFITGKTIDENRQSSHGNFPLISLLKKDSICSLDFSVEKYQPPSNCLSHFIFVNFLSLIITYSLPTVNIFSVTNLNTVVFSIIYLLFFVYNLIFLSSDL